MKIRHLLLCLYIVFLLPHCKDKPKEEEPPTEAACTPPGDAYHSSPELDAELDDLVEGIAPSATAQTGETISDGSNHFFVKPPSGRAVRGQLFVWLPGSGSVTSNFRHILKIAAYAGYHAISLDYKNEVQVETECTKDVDDDEIMSPCDKWETPACEELVRQEIVYGSDAFDSLCTTVTRADSIENRILRVIQHLNATHPGEGYDAYLDATGEGIAWNKVVIAGWSQGGGHAGLIARDHEVARAVFVSKGVGAVDVDPRDGEPEPAPWAFEERATPPSREFGSVHLQEEAHEYSPAAFEAWGMNEFGDPKNIDGLTDYPADYAEYGCTHVIETQATPTCSTGNAERDFHHSMATDPCLALDADGVPLLAPAYYYFFTVAVLEE